MYKDCAAEGYRLLLVRDPYNGCFSGGNQFACGELQPLAVQRLSLLARAEAGDHLGHSLVILSL